MLIPDKITFEIDDPDRSDGYSPYICIADPSESIANMMNSAQVVTQRDIKIRIDYPLNRPATFEHKGGPYTKAQLARLICDDYARVYREEDQTTSIKPDRIPRMFNRNTTDGQYGIWGHFIGDLLLHTVTLKNGVYVLGVDS